MTSYNDFSSTFTRSRKNMYWPEIDYFIEHLKNFEKLYYLNPNNKGKKINILDV